MIHLNSRVPAESGFCQDQAGNCNFSKETVQVYRRIDSFRFRGDNLGAKFFEAILSLPSWLDICYSIVEMWEIRIGELEQASEHVVSP